MPTRHRSRRRLPTRALLLAATAATVAVGGMYATEWMPSAAAATADAGPTGDVNWSGFNWTKETLAAGQTPASPSNISGPDGNGYLTMRLTNTGNDPVGAELVSTRAGFGYGTYTSVVSGPLSTMGPSNVFGGFFTYDGSTPKTHNEIDWHETSRWGLANNPVGLDHSYYYLDGEETKNIATTVPIPADLVQTHVVRWEPGRLTFDSYTGTGTGGRLISHDAQTTGVPVPNEERLVVNLWAFIGNGSTTSATDAKPVSVQLRSLTFVPLEQKSTPTRPGATARSSAPAAPAPTTTGGSTPIAPTPPSSDGSASTPVNHDPLVLPEDATLADLIRAHNALVAEMRNQSATS